ncbi:MAG: RluA family pseudouridine synthase [Firmicutes bacterium]|nr:RluA family pseudouridine synthase [Bacillota bacterium]
MNEDRIITLAVSEDSGGTRLDAYISSQIEELSRNYAQQIIESGCVSVNGKEELSKKAKVKSGDSIEIDYPEPETLNVEPQDIPIEIVYEDDDVIVVEKPRGMVVHPSPGNFDGTLVNALMYHCGDTLSSINGTIRPGIVHRIDKDTSGLLMIAKNNIAHESLAAQLKKHSCTREYTALVYDNIREDELTVDRPIGRDEKNRLRRAVFGSNPKEAVTHIRVVKRYGKYTLIKARLETGRTHQIRVHMSYIKHPLVGDELYGPKKQTLPVKGQMLHAGVLGFVHPTTGEYMEFRSELPEYFTEILDRLDRN